LILDKKFKMSSNDWIINLLEKRVNENNSKEWNDVIKPWLTGHFCDGKGTAAGTRVIAEVIDPELDAINPRETIGKVFCSEKFSDFVFRATRSWPPIVIFPFFAFLSTILGVCDVWPDQEWIGYASASLFVWMFFVFPQYNWYLFKKLLQKFEVWAFIVLSTISYGTMLDMVNYRPDRVVASTMLYLSTFPVVLMDSMPAFPLPVRRFATLFGTAMYSTLVILFYTNSWGSIHQTIFYIGAVQVSIASVSIACFQAITVLQAKYFVLTCFEHSVTAREMLILDAKVVLTQRKGHQQFLADERHEKSQSPLVNPV
jgi:hypothetical protein